MKIRFEKVEIEIPREFIETISAALMRLRASEMEMAARDSNARQSTVSALLAVASSLFREAMNKAQTPVEPPAEPPEAGA